MLQFRFSLYTIIIKKPVKTFTMAKSYPIHWLDNFINSTIHPENNTRDSLLRICSENTKKQIKIEVSTIKTKIKNRIFSMTKEHQVRLYVINHYRSFEVLLSQLEPYKQFKVYQNPALLDILNILKHEILELRNFIELWYPEYIKNSPSSYEELQNGYSKKFSGKIRCNLTGGQTALVLRAADDSKFLVARSMRSVFMAIVPHLSTPQRKNLSSDSLRLKAYTVADKDKEIAIRKLKSIIKKIEKY